MVIVVHKSKLPAILLTILVVVLVGTLAFFTYKYFVPEGNPLAPGDEQIVPLPLVPAESSTEVANEKYYTISASYPSSVPEVKAYVDNAKAELIKIVPTSDADAEYQGLGDGRQYSMTVKTETFASPNAISYVVENYSYTGGAHGITDIVTFTYDRQGKLVTLASLLKDGSSLNALSSKARAYFYEKLADVSSKEAINAGTAPDESNWQRFYFTQEGIVFVFGQYSIGPYVIGIQKFLVTYNEAQSFLSVPSL